MLPHELLTSMGLGDIQEIRGILLFKVPRLMLKLKGKSIEALENPVELLLSAFILFVARQAYARTPGLLGSLSKKLPPAFEEMEPWTVRKP